MASFLSVAKHPFENVVNNIYHELTVAKLDEIYNQLVYKKEAYEEYLKKQKDKSKRKRKRISVNLLNIWMIVQVVVMTMKMK
jgi:hypothetical protein